MTPDQMLQRADLVFIGVIQQHHIDSWPFFRAPGGSPGNHPEWWRPLRRRVLVETVLRGSDPGQLIDVYEVSGILGGATGDWNSTRDNERDLFMVRRENGRWQIVRDWWRSIYRINSGYHARLPLDESRPFWERFALLNYWIGADQEGFYTMLLHHMDPAQKLGWWREVKLRRGLLRHPQRRVRLAACWQLTILGGWGQDECRNMFTESDWKDVASEGAAIQPPPAWNVNNDKGMTAQFDRLLSAQALPPSDPKYDSPSRDLLRMLTAINRPSLRREFCSKFMAKFPNDTDNGCPADKPPAATIVTEDGDVPLVGEWPTLTRNSSPGR
jgi:hypothetical protein